MGNLFKRMMFGFIAIICAFGTLDLFELVQVFLRTEETGFVSFLYILGGAFFFTIVACFGVVITIASIITTIRGK